MLSSLAQQGVVGSACLEGWLLAAWHFCCAACSVIMPLFQKKASQRRRPTFRLSPLFGGLQARPGAGAPIESSAGVCRARQLAAAAGYVRCRQGAEDLAAGWGGNGPPSWSGSSVVVACLPALPSTPMPFLLLAM
jgi:hypothetical protein